MKDKIIGQVVNKFQQRSNVGIKKYGTTLDQNNTDDFITHALEEAMDFVVYLTKIKSTLNSKGYNRLEDVPDFKDL